MADELDRAVKLASAHPAELAASFGSGDERAFIERMMRLGVSQGVSAKLLDQQLRHFIASPSNRANKEGKKAPASDPMAMIEPGSP